MYRVSPFARDFTSGLSSVLVGLMEGKAPRPSRESADALRVALEGVDILYAKGRLKQEEYSWDRKTIEELIGNGMEA